MCREVAQKSEFLEMKITQKYTKLAPMIYVIRGGPLDI